MCQTFLRTKASTYLIYHPEGVPVYGGNLIRERKMCLCMWMYSYVCAQLRSKYTRHSENSRKNARKVTEQKFTSYEPSARRPTDIYSQNQKNATRLFSLGKNTCHLSDVTARILTFKKSLSSLNKRILHESYRRFQDVMHNA